MTPAPAGAPAPPTEQPPAPFDAPGASPVKVAPLPPPAPPVAAPDGPPAVVPPVPAVAPGGVEPLVPVPVPSVPPTRPPSPVASLAADGGMNGETHIRELAPVPSTTSAAIAPVAAPAPPPPTDEVPAPFAVPGEPRVTTSWHTQSAGQSVSTLQTVAVGWHEPGKVIIVVQLSGGDELGATGSEALPPLPPTPTPVPPETGPPPEQLPKIRGWQVKPAPQSTSALQGSCQWNVQRDDVFVTHVGSGTVVGSHFVFGGQGATAAPPEHSV